MLRGFSVNLIPVLRGEIVTTGIRGRGKVVLALSAMTCLLGSVAEAAPQSGSRNYRTPTSSRQSSSRNVTRQTQPQVAGFALVELFTSEGCSSCPSADQNLMRLVDEASKKKLPVYALSFHVDYWNRLGWTDPYSSKAFTDRQRTYAQVMKSDRVYTPQMIVNGKAEFVGSNKNVSTKAINSAMREQPQIRVIAKVRKVKGQDVTVAVQLTGRTTADIVNVALVQKSGQQRANAGENRNRTLKHVNIVRDFVQTKSGAGEVKLTIPKGMMAKDFRVIAYAQNRKREVLGATATTLVASR